MTETTIFEELLVAADRVPDTGEGGQWHRRNEYAWHLREDHAECVAAGDTEGASECILDARDVLAEWDAADELV